MQLNQFYLKQFVNERVKLKVINLTHIYLTAYNETFQGLASKFNICERFYKPCLSD